MPKYRADYDVKATLVLPNGSSPVTIKGIDPDFEIVICNAEIDEAGLVPRLSIYVIADASTIDEVAKLFRSILAVQLDVLTFTTQSTFVIEQCRRVIEWEPYQKVRNFKALQVFDPLYPPSPDLPVACIKTAELIFQAKPADYVLHALHCFRNGVRSEQSEDQFQHFWLTIETIAEGRKTRDRSPIQCPKCSGPLSCSHCQEDPLRRPFSGQAIRDLINITVKPDADVIYRDLSNIRNRLLHGGSSAAAAIKKTGRSLEEIVNLAGNIAWHAIMASMPELSEPLHFGHREGSFSNNFIVAGPSGSFDSEGEYPTEAKIPSVKIELSTKFLPS